MLRWPMYWVAQQIMALLFVMMSFVFRLARGRFFFRVMVLGREKIHGVRRPVILIPIHKTFADHFYLAAALLFNFRILPMRTMAADWIYRIKWWKGGFLLLRLVQILGAFREAKGFGLRTALRTIRAGHSVAIYPEGVAHREVGLAELQKGAIWLARKTGSPLLPVAFRGLEHSSSKEFFFGRRTVTVVFGSPFRLDPNEDMGSAMQKIKRKLEELYNENA